ncbi:MAG: hypothetical protein CMF46_00140 [Legionellales bacterium]|nr:hypothetical protein [Legionellales bacterium]
MTKSSVLRFSKSGVFQERGIYSRKIREKGVFLERGSQLKTAKKPTNAGLLRLCYIGHMKVCL